VGIYIYVNININIYAIAKGGISHRGLSKRDTNLKGCRREIQESLWRTLVVILAKGLAWIASLV
jgi:hypothetical protein